MPRKKTAGLGRGLDAIFLDNTHTKGEENGVKEIKLSLIDPRSDQPRRTFHEESLQSLSESIQAHGLFQPILVREYAMGRYQIIAGERRFRASKLAGLTEIPAIVLDKDDEETARIALVENLQREDLNPIEEAMAYCSLAEEFNMTQEELAREVGKSRSAIANAIRLLDLPEEVLALVKNGDLSAGHARTLLGLNDESSIYPMAQMCIELDLSVRRLEEEVKKENKREHIEEMEEETESKMPVIDYIREMEIRLQSHLGRVVKIHGKGRKKSITLFYEDNEDLDDLLRQVCGDEFLEEM